MSLSVFIMHFQANSSVAEMAWLYTDRKLAQLITITAEVDLQAVCRFMSLAESLMWSIGPGLQLDRSW